MPLRREPDMLIAREISYRYDERSSWLLENLSLSIAPGEIVGLTGPSGRGKTTLGRILAGYLTPARGEVLLEAAPLRAEGVSPVQMLFQHPELAVNPRWRGDRIVCEAYRPSQKRLEYFEIEAAWLKRYPCELSGGQLARLCLVRALAPETRFLIADEITAMLDAVIQARIWKKLVAYAEAQKIGILVISHDTVLLRRLCHRIEADCFPDE
jgi:ABC-type dipeptide/oligopeptide/nickel transport system ATPase subunit